ncbi:MAG: MFS transporter, partial [Dehalococcoidia bacterium]
VLVAGFLLLIVVLSMSLLVRDRPQDMGLHPDGVEPEAVKEQTGRRLRYAGIAEADSFTVRQALRTRAFWTMMLLFSAMFFGVSGLQVHQVAYLQNDANLSVVEATTILSMMLLISGLGRIGVGTLTDFFDLRIVLTLLVATMSAAWCYLLVVPITNFWMGVPFAFIFGIPFGAMVAIRPILMVKLFGGRSMGSLVGIFQSGALASGVVGPVIMGLIFDVQDSYQLAVIIFMCVTLAAIPLALTVKPAAPPPHTPASPPSPELRQPPPS